MSTVTAYLSQVEYASTMPFMLNGPDAEAWRKQVLVGFDRETLSKHILDVLGASAWQTARQTFCYRWRGEDTLTWGDLDNWILIKWLLECLIESHFKSPCLEQYSTLRSITQSTRLHRLAEMYTFHDAATVSSFLSAHSHLIEILFEAYPHLLEHFGPDLKVMLKVVGDPEAEDVERLFAYLLTSLPPEEALIRLDSLDEEWFLDQAERVGALFNFNL